MSLDRTAVRDRVLAEDATVAADFCRLWLALVSRTFALNIRILPRELEETVRLAYLFMRIGDTVEDDRAMPPEERKKLLDLFVACFHPQGSDPELVAEFLAELPPSWKT